MKRIHVVLVFLVVLGLQVQASDPAPASASSGPVSAAVLTNAALIAVSVPKSVFNVDANFGRDPFNPKSTRRSKPAEPVVKEKPVEEPKPEPKKTSLQMNPKLIDRTVNTDDTGLDFLSIKGIIATSRSRTVTLDTTTRTYVFRSGDELFVRVPDNKRMRIRCVEIRSREAVFKLADRPEPIVLKMR